MLPLIHVLVAAMAADTTEANPPWPYLTKIASWDLPEAAVASVVTGRGGGGGGGGFPGVSNASLLVTTFGFGSGDGVWGMENLTTNPTSAGALRFTKLDGDIKWPNMATLSPSPLGPKGWGAGRSIILEAGGFFANPEKATGEIVINDVTDMANPQQYVISHPKSSYFYHRARWFDVDGDGRLDVVAARAYFPTLPIFKSAGELVWLKQPAMPDGGAFNASWEEHVLITPHGPDVEFILHDFDGDNNTEVLAARYFDGKALTLYWCDVPWHKCSPTDVQSRDVGSAEDGPWFSVDVHDLNGDGVLDVLATTNRNDGQGAVWAFEVPHKAARTGTWTAHRLGPAGYAPHLRLKGQGGPGAATVFRLNAGAPERKAMVLVSGDDNGTVCLLAAFVPGDPTNWDYRAIRLVTSSKGTIGTVAVGDIDGDGWAEVVVPSYAENIVELFTFAPPPLEVPRASKGMWS